MREPTCSKRRGEGCSLSRSRRSPGLLSWCWIIERREDGLTALLCIDELDDAEARAQAKRQKCDRGDDDTDYGLIAHQRARIGVHAWLRAREVLVMIMIVKAAHLRAREVEACVMPLEGGPDRHVVNRCGAVLHV